MHGIKGTFRLNKGVKLSSYFHNCSYQNVKHLLCPRGAGLGVPPHICDGWDGKWVRQDKGPMNSWLTQTVSSAQTVPWCRVLWACPLGPVWGLGGGRASRTASPQRCPGWSMRQSLGSEWDFQRKLPIIFCPYAWEIIVIKNTVWENHLATDNSLSRGSEISLNY